MRTAEVLEQWYELVEHTGTVGNQYSRLRTVVSALLPDDVEHGAAGTVGSEPSLMVIADNRLFVARPAADDQEPEIRIDSYPLVAADVVISVVDNPHDMGTGEGQSGDFRRWEFTWASGVSVIVLGELWRQKAWGNPGPDAAELFARELARRLDWPAR